MNSQFSLLADIASIVGLVLTIVGFVVTLRNVITSRKAAEQARAAVNRVREDLARYDLMTELGAAVAIIGEIKRLNRYEDWPLLLDRYSVLRTRLISIRASNLAFSDAHMARLNGAIQQVRSLEQAVETALSKHKVDGLDKARFNTILSAQSDKMTEVLASIRREVGNKG